MLINSLHHQAVKEVAKGFKVVAKSEDGIVEAIENKNIIAVQWHPEYMNDIKFLNILSTKYLIKTINNKMVFINKLVFTFPNPTLFLFLRVLAVLLD